MPFAAFRIPPLTESDFFLKDYWAAHINRKVSACNAKCTQFWNALYIGFYIDNFIHQFINQTLDSTQNFMIDTWNGLWQTHLSLDRKNCKNLGPFATESLSNWILTHFQVKHVFFKSTHVSCPLLLKPFS